MVSGFDLRVSRPGQSRPVGGCFPTGRVHDAADDKAADGAAREVQGRALVHGGVADEAPLGEEVGGQLDGAAEPRPDHGCAGAAVQARDALGAEDAGQAVERVAVPVLGADGPGGRVALQARLDEEEGAPRGGAEDAGGSAAQHVDGHVLGMLVVEEQGSQALAHGLIEAQPTAVEQDLVDVGGAQAAVDTAQALVPDDDADAVQGPAVVVRLVTLGLELALELHAAARGWTESSDRQAGSGMDAKNAYRILTVSKGCVAVTAPQAAMPPATKALRADEGVSGQHGRGEGGVRLRTCPRVVDMAPKAEEARDVGFVASGQGRLA